MSTRLHIISLIIATIVILLCSFTVVYMESSTYNKLTGANTTWWDALWVDLRVATPAK